MTESVIKQVPNILEDPVLIMESHTVSGRITLFGEVYDAAGAPVLAVLELNPTDTNGHALNIIKIASAYGKDTNPQGLINKSKILYVDANKNRTNRWLTVNRLQLPLPSTTIGSYAPLYHKTVVASIPSIRKTPEKIPSQPWQILPTRRKHRGCTSCNTRCCRGRKSSSGKSNISLGH